MLQLAVPLQLSVTADHQENSSQLSNAKAFKSEMQVKDFKKNNVTIFGLDFKKNNVTIFDPNKSIHIKSLVKMVHKIRTRNDLL